MAAPKSAARKPRRKEKKNVAVGQAHIKSTFNNTIVSITDPTGAVHQLGFVRRASASRARASRPRSPRSSPPSPLRVRRRSTA